MQVWNVPHAACWKYSTQKIAKKSPSGHHPTTLSAISSQWRHVSTIGKKLVKQQCLPTCPHNMVNFGLQAAEICWRVWGTPANFNVFPVLAALPHGTLVVGVSQTLRGGHHVGHWPTTFLVLSCFFLLSFFFLVFLLPNLSGRRLDVYHTFTHGVALVQI